MNKYLEKHAFLDSQIMQAPAIDLQMVVVIPVYAEEELLHTLQSISQCDQPQGSVECIVVINAPENADSKILSLNNLAYEEVIAFANRVPSWMSLKVLVHNDLPLKKAGVGLARKIGMDEAVRRFNALDRDGLIINIDADCTCSPNYFTAIQTYFEMHPQTWSGCLDFYHPFENEKGVDRDAIVAYELHLRYFIAAQKAIGLPFAFQTIGSCMVVRSSAYQKRGGMNIRKAGEDFYFIHKFVSIGRHDDILTAKVYPSARSSFRVPFGTGRAVSNFKKTGYQLTSAWQSFLDLQSLVADMDSLFLYPTETIKKWPVVVCNYFYEIDGIERIHMIRENTAGLATFRKQFYQWFDAFHLMKYVHYCRPHYSDQPILQQARLLAAYLATDDEVIPMEQEGLLHWFRSLM